jgi:hypothetical protein
LTGIGVVWNFVSWAYTLIWIIGIKEKVSWAYTMTGIAVV